MMTQFTNATQIPLSLAVWLADDDYDHQDDPNIISATTLLKPLRAIVLARQNKELSKTADISAMIPSRMGSALHTSIEKSWTSGDLAEILEDLGYPKKIIENILVNPKPEEITEDSICIFMEQRTNKKSGKYIISGKFDFVIQGEIQDFKSTGVYNYISGSNVQKYIQQGSIYRWLNPDLVTEDHMKIQYIFTDWSSLKARTDKNYPTARLVEQRLDLMSLAETDAFIKKITTEIEALEGLPEKNLPLCTPEELWQKPDVFKYYKDPAKRARSTKNFDNYQDAATRLAADGGVGIIDTIKGQVVRCRYCEVSGICQQAAGYVADGSLIF